LQQQCKKPSPQRNRQVISTDNPIAAFLHVVVVIGTNPTKVLWDVIVFGRKKDIPLYMHMYDVLELAAGNQELNISVIQLLTM